MKNYCKRVYFKQDILNLLMEKYYTLFVPFSVKYPYYRPTNYFKMSLAVWHYKKQRNSKTVNPREFDDFYFNAKKDYDTDTWLKLALEYLNSMNIDTQEVLSTLCSEEMLKHNEEVEFVL